MTYLLITEQSFAQNFWQKILTPIIFDLKPHIMPQLNGFWKSDSTVDSGYKGMLNRGNSGYRGQFAADQNFYLVKAGQIEEKGAF